MAIDKSANLNLTSVRVCLEPLGYSDEKWFHDLNMDHSVRRYLWDDVIIGADVVKKILLRNHQYFSRSRWGLWKISLINTNDYIGYAGLWPFFEENQPQLLYVLLPLFEGQGYATESAKIVIRYAFKMLDFGFITAAVDEPNVASARLCRRLGMHLDHERVIDGKRTLFFRLDNMIR